uniref:Uncharacterized protein n=1 Tax=Medicago truncatula TaxID=3880 RepID=Q2HTJ5_MEDTR|nr:hypothetical protein MtrDRAFT_AC150440g16v2 [Medicago truncatula]
MRWNIGCLDDPKGIGIMDIFVSPDNGIFTNPSGFERTFGIDVLKDNLFVSQGKCGRRDRLINMNLESGWLTAARSGLLSLPFLLVYVEKNHKPFFVRS